MFKKPPVVEVWTSIGFWNVLDVADDRGRFHRLVKEDFPSVIMPERKNLTYDLGEYSLFSKEQIHRLDISMNYFRFVTTAYLGYAHMRETFLRSLSRFVDCYDIRNYTGFTMTYRNVLPVPKEGSFDYKNFFTFDVKMPDKFQERYVTGQVTLAFRDEEDYLTVALVPQIEGDLIKNYTMDLAFVAQRSLSHGDVMVELIDRSHSLIKGLFLGLFHDEYLEYLQSL